MKTEVEELTLPEIIMLNSQSANESGSPALNQYYKCLEERKIIFNQMVSSSVVELVIIPLLEMDNDGTGKEIEIIISTSGGSQDDGMVLCDVIDNLKTPTTITALGYTYSMGFVFLCAGYNNPNVKKRCYKSSTTMLHEGKFTISGTTTSVYNRAKFEFKREKQIMDYVCSHSKITKAQYKKMNAAETFLTSEEMFKFGLVDEIL